MLLAFAAATAGVLLWAGLEKLRSPDRFSRTLILLGVPPLIQPTLTYFVPTAEVLVAAGLLILPSQPAPRLGLLVLATLFAASGVRALMVPMPIPCSCWASIGNGDLGWRQILLLPAWLAVWLVLQFGMPRWSVDQGLQYFAAVIVILGMIRALTLVPHWREAAADRRALDEAMTVRAPVFSEAGDGGDDPR